jgi:hypothetical protein
MKAIIVALAMLVYGSAYAQTSVSIALTVGQWILKAQKKVYYVQVEATGINSRQAHDEAFRKAVELAVGTVILGESESDGSKIRRNEVITYSSGMIDDYKVISEISVGNRTRIVMDVWVSDSKIANRLLTMGAGEGSTINGAEIRRDWERDQSKKRADDGAIAVMRRVLDDYPKAAYQSKVTNTSMIRVQGRLALSVTVETSFSEQYVAALSEVIQRTRHSSWNSNSGRGVRVYSSKFSNTAGVWKDLAVQDLWEKSLTRPVYMQLTFNGSKNPYSNCWTPSADWSNQGFTGYFNTGGVVDYGFFIVDGNLKKITVYNLINRENWQWSEDKFINWVSGFSVINAKVVDTDECRG